MAGLNMNKKPLDMQIKEMKNVVEELGIYIENCQDIKYRASAIEKKELYIVIINSLIEYRTLRFKIYKENEIKKIGEPPIDKSFDDYLSTLQK